MINQEDILVIDSIADTRMITQGNTAEIFYYGENQILKLFRPNMPREAVFAEYEKVGIIQSVLQSVPRAYEVVLYKNRYGIIYEKIVGSDMIKVMLSKPFMLKSYARKLAHFHTAFLSSSINVGISVKQKLNNEVDLVDDLSDVDKKIVKDYLYNLPDGNKLCHFDFHPGNVMMANDKPIIIDWMTACTGNPNADVARTCLLLQYGELPYANFFTRNLARILEKYIGKIYYKEYKKITGASSHDIDQWILPVAAARLMEWIPDSEKRNLLKVINDRLQ